MWRILLLSALLLSGCAGFKPNADGGYDSYGFLRSLTVRTVERYDANGKLVERETVTSTDSRTAHLLLGANELIGTAVGAAKEVVP
jgi:hypothetical protein